MNQTPYTELSMNNQTLALAVGAVVLALGLLFFATKGPEVGTLVPEVVVEEETESGSSEKDTNTIIREQLGAQ